MTYNGYDGLKQLPTSRREPGEIGMICCFYFKIAEAAPDCSPTSLPRCTFLP